MNAVAVAKGRVFFAIAAALIASITIVPIAGASSSSSTTTTQPVSASMADCGVASSDVVRVVSSDSPCTVATQVASSFEVVLRAGWRWGTPSSDSRSVFVSQMTRTSKGVASVVLTAASPGVATIQASGIFYCAPGKVCPQLAMLWTLKVIVAKSATSVLTLHLTSSDIDNTYRVRPGDRVVLSLGAVPRWRWSEPSAAQSSVLERRNGHAGASASGLFVARGPGRARIVAAQTRTCPSGCSSTTHRFWVTVLVTS
jgi:hypothetical protein